MFARAIMTNTTLVTMSSSKRTLLSDAVGARKAPGLTKALAIPSEQTVAAAVTFMVSEDSSTIELKGRRRSECFSAKRCVFGRQEQKQERLSKH